MDPLRRHTNAIIDAAEAASNPVRIPNVGAVTATEWDTISRTVTRMVNDLTSRNRQP
jgi:hypothetical protein